MSTNSIIGGLTEGRIVHYVDGNFHRPAIITRVWNREDGCSNLTVFKDDGTTELASARVFDLYDMISGTWHFIEPA